MLLPDALLPREVGDRTGDLEDACVRADGEPEAFDDPFEDVLLLVSEGAEAGGLRRLHVRVEASLAEAQALGLPGFLHPEGDAVPALLHGKDGGGRAERLPVDVQLYVDMVEQGSAELGEVRGPLAPRAGAGVPVAVAAAGVEGGRDRELEGRRHLHVRLQAADRDLPVLQRGA